MKNYWVVNKCSKSAKTKTIGPFDLFQTFKKEAFQLGENLLKQYRESRLISKTELPRIWSGCRRLPNPCLFSNLPKGYHKDCRDKHIGGWGLRFQVALEELRY